MTIPTRRKTLLQLAALPAALSSACSRGPDDPRISLSSSARRNTVRTLKRSELTPLEQQYGVGPDLSAPEDPSQYLKLRPDLHIVEEGPKAIRAMNANGLSWVLDPKMTAAIRTGSVLLVTNRCAGRVLATRPAGDQIEVILGPAELSDYIESAKLAADLPIDLDEALKFSAPDFPGAVTRMGGGGAQPSAWHEETQRLHPAIYRPDEDPGRFYDAQLVTLDQLQVDPRFNVQPFINSSRLGVSVTPKNPTLSMTAEASLGFESPEVEFKLVMGGPKILGALVNLRGAANLLLTFDAGNQIGVNNNVRIRYMLPTDFSHPIKNLSDKLPFAITLSQILGIQTAFSSKGTVHARGDYALEGSLRMGFSLGGGFDIGAPGGFRIRNSLVKSVRGVAMAPTGLIFTHQTRVTVGLGGFGFVTGPFVKFTSTAAVTNSGTNNMGAPCREATLIMDAGGGIGYSIPETVTNVINFVLSIFHVKGIQSQGGIAGPTQPILRKTDYYPDAKMCKASGGT